MATIMGQTKRLTPNGGSENSLDRADSMSPERQETELMKFWDNIIKKQQNQQKATNRAANAAIAATNTINNQTAVNNDLQKQNVGKEAIEFATIYKDLIHSGQLTNKIINMEFSYWSAVAEMLQTRDSALLDLQKKSSIEIESAIQQLGKAHTEDTISSLSSLRCQDMAQVMANWNRSIEALKDSQKDEFRDKLKEIWTEMHNPFLADDCDQLEETIGKTNVKSLYSSPASVSKDDHASESSRSDRLLEESFTINLGAQLKMTHNLRLIAVDSLHFCNVTCQTASQASSSDSNIGQKLANGVRANQKPLEVAPRTFSSTLSHQRTHTAMSLYTNNLSAIVLLVDGNFKSHYGIQRDFSQMCNKLTEFHFDSLDTQLDRIRDYILPKCANRTHLDTGDCYITRHSNLANAHVVFHLVTDDSLKMGEINSRHPIISSLRNILRLARMYDIKTISIPLLLLYEMNEEILTVNWCLRRAELVLKCVKGFLIEMAFLSTGVDQGTIQFLVPKGISEDLFTSLSSLIPEVFRLSNPLNLKSP